MQHDLYTKTGHNIPSLFMAGTSHCSFMSHSDIAVKSKCNVFKFASLQSLLDSHCESSVSRDRSSSGKALFLPVSVGCSAYKQQIEFRTGLVYILH